MDPRSPAPSSVASGVVIRTEGLTHDFAAVRALDRLTMEVPQGIVFGFLGPNGAGKTTTIRLLLGLLPPTAGRAEVLGFDTRSHGDEVRARCGALLEHPGLYERLTAKENLDFQGRIYRMPAGEYQSRSAELLKHFGLWNRRHDIVANWSRGMRQKLAVARALLHRPLLVFFDEPTAGLDPVAAAALRDDLAALASREGVTVFITTHNMAEAERLCQLVGVIRQGRLLALGPPDALRARRGGAQVEIRGRGFSDAVLTILRARADVEAASVGNGVLIVTLKDAPDAAPIVRALVESGADVAEVRRSRESLEQVFLSLVEDEPWSATSGPSSAKS